MFYVSRMQKNLVSVSQLMLVGNFVVFRPNCVKVYQDFNVTGKLLMERQRMHSIYVLLAENAYVGNQRPPKTNYIDSSGEQCYTSRYVTVDETSSCKAS